MATANIYDLTDTWNNAGTTFKGIRMNVTNTNSAAASRVFEMAVGGTKVFDVDVSGNFTSAGGTLTSTSATALAVGPAGTTNPTFSVNANTASAATGVTVVGAAAGGGVNLAAISSGTNENLTINAKGSGTVTINGTGTGNITLARATGVTGAITGTSTSATALAVGANGTTNPQFVVNANTASVATGIEVVGAAAAGGVNVRAISSGTNENLTINAKGSGTITIGGTSTGNVIAGRALRVADTFTFGILDTGTASASAGAATLNKSTGKITSEALTTAAAAAYTLTLTNSQIAATDIVLVSVANGTNSAGIPLVGRVTPGSGSVVILIENQHASNAFNGTIVISFVVIKVA